MKKKYKLLVLIYMLLLASNTFAQPTADYYSGTSGKEEASLKTALFNIIKNPSVTTYSQIWLSFASSDTRSDNIVWDMYSDIPSGNPHYSYTISSDQCTTGGNSAEGECYNREHSFPKSWFGNASPMDNDLMHVVPSDGYVNNRRSNYPYGEVGNAYWISTNGSKLGDSNFPGYSSRVFEPIDEYKGDFARIYFYMVTAYEDKLAGWSSPQLSGDTYPAFSSWSVDLLMKWSREDEVSEKEIIRNNAVYQIQGNRNPFVDFPNLAEYVWGDSIDFNPETSLRSETASNESVLLSPDFKSELFPFSVYNVTGDQLWESSSSYGAYMSGYEGGAFENEDWLISPALDLSERSSATLSFRHAINYAGNNIADNHSLWISDNYSGGSPFDATWEEIIITNYPSGSNWTFVQSGDIAIPEAYIGKTNVNFAFKYSSSTSNASTWEIDNLILVAENQATFIYPEINHSEINIFASRNEIVIEADRQIPVIEVYNMSGQLICIKEGTVGKQRIAVPGGRLYIVRVNDKIQKVMVP